MKKEIITRSEQETLEWAEKLGTESRKGSIYALYGELGTGKTVIAKGIAKGLGIKEEITSPTFLMLEIYQADPPLYHFDLYRIDNAEELDELAFEDYWEGDGISIIEWPEKAGDRIPRKAIKINVQWINNLERRIIVEYPGI